ncbi:helix-turn-helix domain-containing protein [Bradyrhizobium sp. ORS 285]|uniref:helix-turn-helix domain-containing protein n=1 Tax=Bradyrhizobium sp. ORS 285 TaxID=115808 RepID=UPI00054F1EA4|nr:helix-turn-helix domain-containing protein [Bradyrhizobium sp. ORS 285]
MSARDLERPITLPSKEDTALAQEASRAIATKQPSELKVRLDDGQELTLPKAATRLIAHLLTEMAQGNAVTIIPIHAVLTTQEAADYLNVSRPHLVSLLEEKRIPYHKVGTHRRVRFQDLVDYRAAFEKRRREIMEELAAQAEQEDMGY